MRVRAGLPAGAPAGPRGGRPAARRRRARDRLVHLLFISARAAIIRSIAWTALGAAFAIFFVVTGSGSDAEDYLSGFLIEKSLSLDNLFVFAILFRFLSVPQADRRRVLVFGIAGAIVLRALFILAGAELLDRFDWFTYVLGAVLAYTAITIARHGDEEMNPDDSRVMQLVYRVLPDRTSPGVIALVAVAAFDVMFAIDSIPAIFAITRDTTVVFAANAFSLMGMVSLFFALEHLLDRFRYLSQGLAVILGYVALKLLLEDVVHLPEWVNLAVVFVTLTAAALLSRRKA